MQHYEDGRHGGSGAHASASVPTTPGTTAGDSCAAAAPKPRPTDDPTEFLGGLHGAGGEYEVVNRTDAGAALGSLAGSFIGSVGAGVAGASLGASAAAVTGAAGMGAALGAVLGHSFGSGGAAARLTKLHGGDSDAYDGGDVPLIGDEDIAIERASRVMEVTEAAAKAEKRRQREALQARDSEAAAGGAVMVPELIGLQPLCELGVNAGMYLGHGHTTADE
ncbi:hypothetical protein Vafri_8069 [Volvox africanus]|uniref:Uncharacterized protein n=1 Tax=Volvox africanus TaxID=51714 RepID=A0A8J4B1J3_9CHLO|nr:hypothetical protein Vafri_8069 [Volvox africanus]